MFVHQKDDVNGQFTTLHNKELDSLCLSLLRWLNRGSDILIISLTTNVTLSYSLFDIHYESKYGRGFYPWLRNENTKLVNSVGKAIFGQC